MLKDHQHSGALTSYRDRENGVVRSVTILLQVILQERKLYDPEEIQSTQSVQEPY